MLLQPGQKLFYTKGRTNEMQVADVRVSDATLTRLEGVLGASGVVISFGTYCLKKHHPCWTVFLLPLKWSTTSRCPCRSIRSIRHRRLEAGTYSNHELIQKEFTTQETEIKNN